MKQKKVYRLYVTAIIAVLLILGCSLEALFNPSGTKNLNELIVNNWLLTNQQIKVVTTNGVQFVYSNYTRSDSIYYVLSFKSDNTVVLHTYVNGIDNPGIMANYQIFSNGGSQYLSMKFTSYTNINDTVTNIGNYDCIFTLANSYTDDYLGYAGHQTYITYSVYSNITTNYTETNAFDPYYLTVTKNTNGARCHFMKIE